ncbi:MAG: type VI secretion system protein TssA [Fibrobacteres bacterium]|nr:type VI secretion system protein TssA [Fibrobacterota bacterium]
MTETTEATEAVLAADPSQVAQSVSVAEGATTSVEPAQGVAPPVASEPAEPALLPLASALVAPISAANPVGDDPKYSAEFEYVKAEIVKTTERDWEQITTAARKVLTAQAKDITLLCYHLVSSTVWKGWGEGAAAGQTLAKLMTDHWDALHPLRDRARQNSIKWLTEERTMGTFEQVAFTAADHPYFLALSKALNIVRTILNEKFPDSPPSIKPLLDLVDAKAKATRPVEASKPVVSQSATSSGGDSDGGGSSGPSIPAPTVGDGASKGDLFKALQKVALQLSAAEPDNPTGYKLLRICRWQEVAAAPKNDAGKTTFAPPNPQRRSFLEGQVAQRAWSSILEKCEAIFTEPGMQYWLDLQCWVAQSLSGRGHESCSEAVRTELRGLLKRVPQLLDLKFSDGSPLASPPTREWLELVMREGSGGAARSAAAREDTLETDLAQAREVAGSGNVADALELLQAGLIYGDLRSRTMRQLEIARVAFSSGKIRPALSVSAEIAERSFRMDLASWEPQLAREILEIHLKSLNAAIDAGLGDVAALKARREVIASRAGNEDPSLLARFEF